MENTKKYKIITIAKKVAIYSTTIGTIILVGFLIAKSEILILFGLCYILTATIINSVFLILLFIACLRNIKQWRKFVAMMIFMLLNIPLSIIYCYIATI